MNTLQITYFVDDSPNIVVYQLASVAHWGISLVPRRGRRAPQYKIDVVMLPTRIKNAEGDLVNDVVTSEYLFNSFEEARNALFVSTVEDFQLSLTKATTTYKTPKDSVTQPPSQPVLRAGITDVSTDSLKNSLNNSNRKNPIPLPVAKDTPTVSVQEAIDPTAPPKPNPSKWLSSSHVGSPNTNTDSSGTLSIPTSIHAMQVSKQANEAPNPKNLNTTRQISNTYLDSVEVATLPISDWSKNCLRQGGIVVLSELLDKSKESLVVSLGARAAQELTLYLNSLGFKQN